MSLIENRRLREELKNSVTKTDSQGKKIYSYIDMLVYNDLLNNPEDKISEGLEPVMEVYDKLHGFGLALSGYQFIGLVLEKSVIDDGESHFNQFAYFMLAIGFIISLFGSLLSFCMYEFLSYIKKESNEYIVKSIINYREELKLPHIVLLVNTFCFAIPINILIHYTLISYYAIIFNVISLWLLCKGFPIHRKMVANNQKYASAYIFLEDNQSINETDDSDHSSLS